MRRDLILTIRDIYINSNLNQLAKFTSSNRRIRFKDIFQWFNSQMIHKNYPNQDENKLLYVMQRDTPFLSLTESLFLLTLKTQPKIQPGWEINFQTNFCECSSDTLGLAKFLRLAETLDWSKLFKAGKTYSK